MKAGVSSKQFWNSETLAKMYRPSLALDMATTRRRTSLWSEKKKNENWFDTRRVKKKTKQKIKEKWQECGRKV